MKFYSKIKLHCLFILLLYNVAIGQKDTNFTQLDKPFGSVYTIEQDSLGYIWISNYFGIYKFDGSNYFLKSNNDIFKDEDSQNIILNTLIDKKGNHWFSSRKGELTKIDKNNKLVYFNEELKKEKKSINISNFKLNGNDVWMGSSNGIIYKYNAQTSKIDSLTALPEVNGFHQKIKDLTFTNKKQLWISTHEGRVYNYSISDSKLFKVNSTLRKAQEVSIDVDYNGKLWMVSEVEGLYFYDSISKSFEKFNSHGILKENSEHPFFRNIFCDKKGNIWLGTDGDGLYKVNSKTYEVSNFKNDKTNPFSLNSNSIIKIYEDFNGHLWFVGKKYKISILPIQNKNINYYSGAENNNPTSTLSILKSSDGSLWIGTDGEGINRVYPKQ